MTQETKFRGTFHNLGELAEKEAREAIDIIVSFTNGGLSEKPQMMPVCERDILDKHIAIVALSEKGSFAGFIGATPLHPHNDKVMSEVGTLLVMQPHRKLGVGHILTEIATQRLVGARVTAYAFCNEKSLPIFTQFGYRPAAVDNIPPAAFEACDECPKKNLRNVAKGIICCDTPVIYTGENV